MARSSPARLCCHSSMRVLLQNTETRLYYAGPDRWTKHALDAMDFEYVEHAARMYEIEDLAYAQIVLDPGLPGIARLPIRVAKHVEAQE